MSDPVPTKKLLTAPIISRASSDDSCYPTLKTLTHLGPWPLKRHRTSVEISQSTCTLGDDGSDQEDQPNLTATLARVDEECATITRILSHDIDAKMMVSKATSMDEVRERERERGRGALRAASTTRQKQKNPYMTEGSKHIICWLLGVSTTIIFVATPILTFLFAKKGWGGVVLHEKAPSKTALAALLTFPITSVAMMVTTGTACFWEIHSDRKLFRRTRNAMLLVLVGLTVGLLLNVWVLVTLMPLVSHA